MKIPVITPIFHELWGELYSIPLNTSNASHKAFILLCKHMLKCMTKFMEDSLNLKKY